MDNAPILNSADVRDAPETSEAELTRVFRPNSAEMARRLALLQQGSGRTLRHPRA